MAGTNEMGSVEGQLVGLPLAGPETFTIQQLAYLKKALGLDETVLFSAMSQTPGDTQQTYNLSESTANFERVRVYILRPMGSGALRGVAFLELYTDTLGSGFGVPLKYSGAYDASYLDGAYYCKVISATQWQDLKSAQGTGYSYYAHIYKIVGVHRIAGGN